MGLLTLASLSAVVWVNGQTQQPVVPLFPFDPQDMTKSLNRIYETDRFRGVDVLQDPVTKEYKIIVWEKIRIETIVFANQPPGTDEPLARLVQRYLAKEYSTAKLAQIEAQSNRILRDAGYLSAEAVALVKPSEEDSTHVSISIEVKEGVRTQLSKIETNIQDSDSEKKTLGILGIKADRALDLRSIKESITAFPEKAAKKNFFRPRISSYEVAISEDKASATLKLQFDPIRILDFHFLGDLGGVSASELSDHIRGQMERFRDVSEAGDSVRQYYLKHGYSDVKVTTKEFPTGKAATDSVHIEIKAGTRTRLVEIKWIGLTSLSADELDDFLARFGPETLKHGYYSKDDLSRGIEELEVHFKNRGLFSARVQSIDEKFNSSRTEVTITLTVLEGTPTRIQSISLPGVPLDLQIGFVERSGLRVGELLNLSQLEVFLKTLPDYLKEKGYFYSDVGDAVTKQNSIVHFSPRFDTADLEIPIRLGPMLRFGAVNVYGLKKTKTKVVTREIQWKEGEAYEQDNVDETRFRLTRTGLFRSVRIEFNRQLLPEERKQAFVTVPVDMYLDERPAGLFETGLGVRTDDGVKGSAGVIYRNLTGMNRIFSSRVELNAKFPNQYEFLEPSVTLSYIEPWLGPLPVALRSNIIFEKKDDFDQDKLSGEFNSELQYQLSRHYGFKYLVYGISASKIFNQRLSDGSIDRVTEVSERTVVVGPGITVDYRNDPFNPSRGWIATTTMRFSDPFLGSDADIKFLHIFTTLRGYYPILSKLVFATYFGHGVEWARGDGHISTDYILKLGGRSSLRSYAHNSIGPTGTDFSYIRNSQSFNTRAELRWSVWEEFGLAFFWDGGTVLVNDGPVSGFRHSVGPGLRYKTPVGPIAFDVAFSVDNEPRPPGQNSDWRIFFSLGTF